MCMTKVPKTAAQRVIMPDSGQIQQEATVRERARRLRAGPAANILTTSRGLGVASQLGAVQ